MKQYHIAQSGKNAGKKVACYAKNCRLTDPVEKQAQTFYQTQLAKTLNVEKNRSNKHLGDTYARTQHAIDQTASQEILNELAFDKKLIVVQAVAENPSTSPETLAYLSTVKEGAVQMLVAANPNTNAETINFLTQNEEDIIRSYAYAHDNLPVETMYYALNNKTSEEYSLIASSNPNAPTDFVTQVWNKNNKNVWVLSNPNADMNIVRKYWEENKENLDTAITLTNNINLPADILTEIAYKDYGTYYDGSPNYDAKTMVAIHPNAPQEVLQYLADQPDALLETYVAFNYNASPELLAKMYDKGNNNSRLLSAIAANPNTPKHILKILTESTYWEVRTALAKNPSIDESDLFGYLIHSDKEIRTEAYYNPANNEDIRLMTVFTGGVNRDYWKDREYKTYQTDKTKFNFYRITKLRDLYFDS